MSPFIPWGQRPVTGALAGEQPAKEGFKWTWPWQQEHWTEQQPSWTRTVGKAGLGVGLTAGSAAAGMLAPGALFGLGSRVPWLGGLASFGAKVAPKAGHLGLLGGVGGLGGLLGSIFMGPGELGESRAVAPSGVTTPPALAPTTPKVPTGEEPPTTFTPPSPYEVTTESGDRYWYDPVKLQWFRIESPQARMTPEQETEQARLDREARMAELMKQFELEEQRLRTEMELRRGMQEASAAQAMAQMYASDPYKYWAQLGTPTPEAVARLTGGQIQAGEQFGQVPLSTPSAQWWGNLLPSEQQQIMGATNWLGINPADWVEMYQRMIPGLGSRQVEPRWVR